MLEILRTAIFGTAMLERAVVRRVASRAVFGQVVATLFFMGCGAAQSSAEAPEQSASMTESAPEQQGVSEAPQCVDDQEQRVSCLTDTDCCSGFVCGKDPELSHRLSYCIYGG